MNLLRSALKRNPMVSFVQDVRFDMKRDISRRGQISLQLHSLMALNLIICYLLFA